MRTGGGRPQVSLCVFSVLQEIVVLAFTHAAHSVLYNNKCHFLTKILLI